ncbi:MAG TPA: galactokinase [Blastocatellia bacterium]|jgi:galactokinase|nr:galactokinase [Blastocatellia bacterium]
MANIDAGGLHRAFRELYGNPARLFSAPGRVNLIGEHTDYNDGFVLPIAIDRRTFVAAARRNDSQVRVHSFDLDQEATFDLRRRSIESKDWLRYIEGVARLLQEMGFELAGADIAISSAVPMGAGLSSSAALELSIGLAFLRLAEREVDLVQLALASQKAEHLYAGTKCGIMDQLTVAFGQKDHALLIDCRSLEVTPIELNLSEYSVVVCNTNVKHELAMSAYNERRAECERGVALLREKMPQIQALRDVNVAEFDEYANLLPEPIRRRCRHVVTENDRTLRAADTLRKGDVKQFGNLMLLSHRSLQNDYEVSCRELDVIVEIAMSYQGVAGARMTGGGFGGCTVNLVRRNAVVSFREFVESAYQHATGRQATSYVVKADDGVSEILDDWKT